MSRLQFRVWDKYINKMLYEGFILRSGNCINDFEDVDEKSLEYFHCHAEPLEEPNLDQHNKITEVMGDISAYYSLVDWSNHYYENYITMQCTGFHDKNGQLIWEGDLLKFGTITDVVSWYYCNYIWNGQMIADFRDFDKFGDEVKTEILKGYQGDVFGLQTCEMEKVGNIFEHGEQFGFNIDSINCFKPSFPV